MSDIQSMPVSLIKQSKDLSPNNVIRKGSFVDYEQHGHPVLSLVVDEKKGKWALINPQGSHIELAASRLYLFPSNQPLPSDQASQIALLQRTLEQAAAIQEDVRIDEVWEVLGETSKEYQLRDITELACGKSGLLEEIAVRRVLLADRIYFRRGKLGFEPRSAEAVEQLRMQIAEEERKRIAQEALVNILVTRLLNKSAEPSLPAECIILEEAAALGKNSRTHADATRIIDLVCNKTKLSFGEKLQEQAFQLLVQAKHFHPDKNLTPIALGRRVAFPPSVIEETMSLIRSFDDSTLVGKDRFDLEVITIDDAATRDVDDALSLETTPDGYIIGIHITNVASSIPHNGALEREIFFRCTSIYCADEVIPMLPDTLSEDVLSLHTDKLRSVMSFYVSCDSSYTVQRRWIEMSRIRVRRRMSYEEVDQLLFAEGGTDIINETLLRLWDAACAWEARRYELGSQQFTRKDIVPRLNADGRVILEDQSSDSPARKLVGELMIIANETAAIFARENRAALIFRSQEKPDCDPFAQGQHIPEGAAREYFQRGFMKRSLTSTRPLPHSGLGLEAYAQLSSPIRRAHDYLNQRQILSLLEKDVPVFEESQLRELLEKTETSLSEAYHIQRERSRYWLLKYIQQEAWAEITGTVLRLDGAKPLAELDKVFWIFPFHPYERKGPEEKARPLSLGHTVRLRIEQINPRKDIFLLREIREE